MEPIVTHDVSRSFDKFTGAAITVYFPDKNQYKLFLKESEQLCPPSYPCKIWAKGIARYVDTETVTLLGRQKLRIGFVAADEIRLYEGKTHALVDGASLGLKTFMKIYPMLPKSEK
jgi:hypothetical protein